MLCLPGGAIPHQRRWCWRWQRRWQWQRQWHRHGHDAGTNTSSNTGADAEAYRALLAEDAVQPGALDLYVADADGQNARQVTRLPGANWAPFFHPSGEQVLFASNHHTLAEGGREFDLFLVDLDGENLERVTFSGTFDAFPMFSPDGTKLVFASNRRGDRADSRDTNVFVADWVETPTEADRLFGTE